jgi:hypothetical protein
VTFPLLKPANPLMKDGAPTGPIHDAQWLMSGNGRFGEAYYHGKVDGVYGPSTALSAHEAKYWCGYAAAEIDNCFGEVLYSYLLPLASGSAVKLPMANRVRRQIRVANAQALEYVNPYRSVSNLGAAGIDQGVDYSGYGPVYAIGPARVTVVSNSSGWPGGGAVGYTFTAGEKAGQAVYFVENIAPKVKPGQLVDHRTVIAEMFNSYPYTEQGWAFPGTVNPLARLYPNPHSPKPQGRDFNEFLRSLGVKPIVDG